MAKKRTRSKPSDDVEARLSALEEEVRSLREQLAPSPATRAPKKGKPERFWAIENVKRRYPDGGGVAFGGYVTLPTEETFAWQIEAASNDLFEADWTPAQAPLAALAHPVRLTLLQAILCGSRETQALRQLPNIGTTGQLYHHLKELESAGWIRQPRRGQYHLLAERVVPLLAILAACEITDRKYD